MKSGTTTLFDFMSQHPQIAASTVKEPDFFIEENGDFEVYQKLWDYDPALHRYAMEASTAYSKHPRFPGAAKRMLSLGLRPKFIYVLRNPFDRIESHYRFSREILGHKQSLGAESQIAISNYYLQLSQFLKCFERDRFLILRFEDLKNPQELAAKLGSFLQVKASLFPSLVSHANKTSERMMEKRLSRKPLVARVVAKMVPGPIKDQFRKLLRDHVLSDGPKLSSAQRAEIKEVLRPGMQQLREEFGVNISEWGF
ncbi:MAG: sulfotransferase domain-containing protein [Bdellovibrionaceae bacterium]|nr:sulfotransferase domain-containing protein [Pseudobdellovibrionaceae bacterium]